MCTAPPQPSIALPESKLAPNACSCVLWRKKFLQKTKRDNIEKQEQSSISTQHSAATPGLIPHIYIYSYPIYSVSSPPISCAGLYLISQPGQQSSSAYHRQQSLWNQRTTKNTTTTSSSAHSHCVCVRVAQSVVLWFIYKLVQFKSRKISRFENGKLWCQTKVRFCFPDLQNKVRRFVSYTADDRVACCYTDWLLAGWLVYYSPPSTQHLHLYTPVTIWPLRRPVC